MQSDPIVVTRNARPAVCRVAQAIVCGALLAPGAAQAGWNDYPMFVKVTNVKTAPRDAKTALVSFNLNWMNNWRQEGNLHDALWVVFKVRPEGAAEWQSVRLVADPASPKGSAAASKVKNPAGYGQESGTPLEFLVPSDEGGPVGMFVRRAEYGYGLVVASNVTAVWDFTANQGITKDVKVDIAACAIEMVYIPEGAFYLGTGELMPFHFYHYNDGEQHNKPYRVTSEGAIPTGQQDGKLWAWNGAQPEDKGEIPESYPKGYGAFYCMKTQIKGGHYRDFLNTLTAEQATKHVPDNHPFTRSGTPPSYIASGETTVHLYHPVSWADGIAFASWAGLRPMSELEYVKIGRGMMEPTIETGDKRDHPSCWGVTDWTGWRTSPERAVTVANPQGRGFKGTHGRGTLAVPADWPQDDAVGSGIYGGFGPVNGHPSTRTNAAKAVPERAPHRGWRGVRTAPREAVE